MRKWLSRQAHNLKFVGSNPTPAPYEILYFVSFQCIELKKIVKYMKKTEENLKRK